MARIFTETNLDAFVASYIECALWSSVNPDHYDNPDVGECLDADYDADDLDELALSVIRNDCEAFIRDNARDLIDYVHAGRDLSDAGHDFWLTRNHHGAGFWDRGLGDLGDRLTKAAHAYGDCDIYPGDDGKLYI